MPHKEPTGLDPEEAVNMYLTDRSTELADATLESYKSRLSAFSDWCSANDIDDTTELDGRVFLRFRKDRSDTLSGCSLKGQMDTLRAFIRWLEAVDAVEKDTHSKVLSPSDVERSRDTLVSAERAQGALDWLDKYEYGSLHHALLALMWRTAARTGTLRSLDTDDIDIDHQQARAVHRPETGTPLKNGTDGQRVIALSTDVCTVLSDWVDHQRPDVTDDYDRSPLFATRHGRVSISTVREAAYRWTRPCAVGKDCPHERDPEECSAVQSGPDHAPSTCPSSRSPHCWRRGALTHQLTSDVPVTVVSDRADVSRDVLEEHYDQRTESEKAEKRREFLEDF